MACTLISSYAFLYFYTISRLRRNVIVFHVFLHISNDAAVELNCPDLTKGHERGNDPQLVLHYEDAPIGEDAGVMEQL